VVRHVEACVLNHPIGRHTAAGAGMYEDANVVDVSRLNAQRRRCAITPTPPADRKSHSPASCHLAEDRPGNSSPPALQPIVSEWPTEVPICTGRPGLVDDVLGGMFCAFEPAWKLGTSHRFSGRDQTRERDHPRTLPAARQQGADTSDTPMY
jgi:hypothetical protein